MWRMHSTGSAKLASCDCVRKHFGILHHQNGWNERCTFVKLAQQHKTKAPDRIVNWKVSHIIQTKSNTLHVHCTTASALKYRELKDVVGTVLNPNRNRNCCLYSENFSVVFFSSLFCRHRMVPFIFFSLYQMWCFCEGFVFYAFVCFMHQKRIKGKKKRKRNKQTNIEGNLSRISRRDNNNISLCSYYLIFKSHTK